MTKPRVPPLLAPPKIQRGATLFIVIVFVLLSMLLALWASRAALFNEMVVGNDADYQRAYEAAQALLQDAELDIRGENAHGGVCNISTTNGDVCRATTPDKIPLESAEVVPMLTVLEQQAPTRCRNALCAKRVGAQDFWNNSDEDKGPTLAQMATAGVGARYGQYTGARLGTSSAPANPILADNDANNRGGWYWIEVLPYDESSKNAGVLANLDAGNRLALNLDPVVVYRITALAFGRKPKTMAVLQQTYAQQKLKD